MSNLSASDVAAYLIEKVNQTEWDDITNLKLQKMLYYCQGFSIAILKKSLFSDKILAWKHGPVIRSVYNDYRKYNGDIITEIENGDLSKLSNEQKCLIDDVYSVYGKYSAWHLRNLTHEEPTWKNIYEADKDNEITLESLEQYFSTQLVES